jgi:hypothetical protein
MNIKSIEDILKIAKENTELPILAKVGSGVIPCDTYGWFFANIGNCYIETYCSFDESISLGEDDIKEALVDKNYKSTLPDDEFEDMINILYDNLIKDGKVKKTIIVDIVAMS